MNETRYAMARRRFRIEGRPVIHHAETVLLLCCARTHMDSESADQIRALLWERIDWLYLLQTAHQHGMAPLLYRGLNSVCPEAVPELTFKQLRHDFHMNALRNLLLVEELTKVLSALEARQVRALPFKGPVLAASAYGHLALRQFSDLDILIHEKDVTRAKHVLGTLGYRLSSRLSDAEQAAHRNAHYVYNFRRDGGPAPLDLQWGITCVRHLSFPLDFDPLWEHRELIEVNGRRLAQAPAEDLLLFLCVHGSRHRWSSLKWICDVAEFVRANPDIHWDRLLKRALRVDCKRMLLLGLRAACDLLGMPMPREVGRHVLSDPDVSSLAARVSDWLFLEEGQQPRFLESTFFYFRSRERMRTRLPYLADFFRTVATSTEEKGRQRSLLGCLSTLYRLFEVIA